jgi:Type I phosphodiesterase / nucleotide pyrophosphatase
VSGRRLFTLLVVLAAIGLPAGILQAFCVGRSCEAERGESPRVPFCPLPATLRDLLASGYREGRSPDVLGVVQSTTPVYSEIGGIPLSWPAAGTVVDDVAVPLAFAGAGVRRDTELPPGVTLDRVAPTIAQILGFERPFPNVRSGTRIDGVAGGDPPTLVLVIGWKGVGAADLSAHPEDWPFLESLLDEGAGTLEASTGSLPLDPAATLTTLGTGGLPSQHGITGSFIRNETGEVVAAFGAGAPVPIIATLADDLDAPSSPEVPSPYEQRPVISLVATDDRDRGLIGGDWYENHDADRVILARGADAVSSVRSLLADHRDDGAPDLLGVVLDGSVRSMDRRSEQIVATADDATHGSVLVVLAGTGDGASSRSADPDDALVSAVEDAVPGEAPAVAATVPGGFFLDQRALTEAQVSGQVAVDALLAMTGSDGREMMADAFQGFAVSFARYC